MGGSVGGVGSALHFEEMGSKEKKVNGISDSLEEATDEFTPPLCWFCMAVLESFRVVCLPEICRLSTAPPPKHPFMQAYRYVKNQNTQGNPMRTKAATGYQG